MKSSKIRIGVGCLIGLAALVMIGQFVFRPASFPKTMDYEEALQLLQKNGISGNETAYVWKSKDDKLIFHTTEDMKYVLESESKGVYMGDDSIQQIKVLTDNTHIQVIGEDNSIIFEGYGKYDMDKDNINVLCKSNNANLLSYDINGFEWVDFYLMKRV